MGYRTCSLVVPESSKEQASRHSLWRPGTMSPLSHSIDQSKSQVQLRVRERENDPILTGRATKSHLREPNNNCSHLCNLSSNQHIHHFYPERCCWKCQDIFLFKEDMKSWTKSSALGLTIQKLRALAMKTQCASICQNGYCQKDKE